MSLRLLTAQEVSSAFQIPLARVYELARLGLIPKVPLGNRQVRFDEERLREWVRTGGGDGARTTQTQTATT